MGNNSTLASLRGPNSVTRWGTAYISKHFPRVPASHTDFTTTITARAFTYATSTAGTKNLEAPTPS